MLFDQWAALYGRYKVHGVKYRILVSGVNTPSKVIVVPSNSVTQPVDYSDAAEMPYAKTSFVDAVSKTHTIVKGYIGMRKLYGRKELENKDEALVSASPTETAVLNIWTYSQDGATNLSNVNYDIEMLFYCEMFDRSNVVGS